jgi:FixJ family two-component response regulator
MTFRARATDRPRVIVADDDDDFRDLVSSEVVRLGYDSVQARSSADVVSYLAAALVNPKRYPPAFALVSDVRMPGQSGLELLASLANGSYDLPVILMTAFGDTDVYAAAARWGAVAILEKPFGVAELQEALTAAE